MEEIIDILVNCSLKHIIIGDDIIRKIFTILINIDDLTYIDLQIKNKKSRFLAVHQRYYNYFEENNSEYDSCSLITVYKKKIEEYIKKNKYKTDFLEEDLLSLYEQYLRINLEILEIIMHEIEHAKEKIKAKLHNESVENRLIKLEYDMSISLNKCDKKETLNALLKVAKSVIVYEANYDIAFSERMARVNPLGLIIDELMKKPDGIESLFNLKQLIYEQILFQDYIKMSSGIIAPTTVYFGKLGLIEEFKAINIESLDFEERYRLGLHLSEEEYSYLEENQFLKSVRK